MTAAAGPARVEKMVKVLRQWQGIERQAMTDMAEIMEETKNPLIRLIMEIIRHDSLMHHRVQQDVAEIWEKIQAHDEVEKKTIRLAQELRDEAWSPVHKQLLDYLLADESKHDRLLEQLEQVKQSMSRSPGG